MAISRLADARKIKLLVHKGLFSVLSIFIFCPFNEFAKIVKFSLLKNVQFTKE
jgi:hypothetical protein